MRVQDRREPGKLECRLAVGREDGALLRGGGLEGAMQEAPGLQASRTLTPALPFSSWMMAGQPVASSPIKLGD